MRLIDANKLREDILTDKTNDPDIINYYAAMVDGMETVYNVDKVVEQLEAREYNFGNVAGVLKGAGIRAEVYAHAIKIVKGGGVDE